MNFTMRIAKNIAFFIFLLFLLTLSIDAGLDNCTFENFKTKDGHIGNICLMPDGTPVKGFLGVLNGPTNWGEGMVFNKEIKKCVHAYK